MERHCGFNFGTELFLSYFCVSSIFGSWLMRFVVGHFGDAEKG